eukprot:CAMPEP_0116838830 /NCGR_PEP_ID=MMETSP0418-20121206/9432_1 /TAXON_ID=1158023 /ORGANISM="Astrosyne radiata, Strain 13vi08-1A" /LENGTH=280 /DNA_ID=CAMNT_0004468879 /DNA_START=91 /DNA_END=933 /DNA_ORIENTATION=+
MFWEIKQQFGIGKREQRIWQLTKVLNAFADRIIQATKDREEAGDDPQTKASETDIVHRYIKYCRAQNEPIPTNKEMRDLVLGFAFAGRDTTTAGLSWTLYEVTKHKSVQARLLQELRQVVGNNKDISWDMLMHQLPYLHAVVMESLRLHAPAPESFRFAKADDVLPDGTKIPAGALIQFSSIAINRSTEIWGKDGADEFMPDRFFQEKEPSPYRFPTFGAGPRACPGKNLAMMEIKLIVAYLVLHYELEDASNHDGDYHWTIAMSMKNGFPVRLQKRKQV